MMRRELHYVAIIGLLALVAQLWTGPLGPVAWTVWAVAGLFAVAADWATQRWGNPRQSNNNVKNEREAK